MLDIRAFVNRKKGTVGGTNLLGWQLALVIVGSVIAFLLISGLCFWIIRRQRKAYLDPEPEKDETPKPKNGEDADAATLCETKHGTGTIGETTSQALRVEEDESQKKELRAHH
jgi:hypothetical protein